jgi:curli biogenesis system outer membrane secretion channel CsgG
MMRKILSIIALVCLLINFANAQDDSKQGLKKRVAVFEFEDKTDHNSYWWTGQPVGQGMADMLTTELVKSGKYRVMERQAIEKIMQEQNLGQSGAVTPESAAKVGQLLGVELAIVASVTEFGYKKGNVGGDLHSNKPFINSIGIESSSSSVGIDVRFVNTSTGEILAADNVRKEEKKRGVSLGTKAFDFKNQNEFDESLVGKATRKAIEELVEKIDEQMEGLPWQAKIIKVTGNTVIINSGSEAGVNVGDVFDVYSKGEELIDPDTGLSLGAEEEKVGEIKVDTNNIGNGKASKCTITRGSGITAGNVVRTK